MSAPHSLEARGAVKLDRDFTMRAKSRLFGDGFDAQQVAHATLARMANRADAPQEISEAELEQWWLWTMVSGFESLPPSQQDQ